MPRAVITTVCLRPLVLLALASCAASDGGDAGSFVSAADGGLGTCEPAEVSPQCAPHCFDEGDAPVCKTECGCLLPDGCDARVEFEGAADAGQHCAQSQSCVGAIESFRAIVQEALEQQPSCARDSDCGLVNPDFSCTEAQSLSFGNLCPRAIHIDHYCILEAVLISRKEEYCSPCQVDSSCPPLADCAPRRAACVDGVCADVDLQ